jgi:hypothetical protein
LDFFFTKRQLKIVKTISAHSKSTVLIVTTLKKNNSYRGTFPLRAILEYGTFTPGKVQIWLDGVVSGMHSILPVFPVIKYVLHVPSSVLSEETGVHCSLSF